MDSRAKELSKDYYVDNRGQLTINLPSRHLKVDGFRSGIVKDIQTKYVLNNNQKKLILEFKFIYKNNKSIPWKTN